MYSNKHANCSPADMYCLTTPTITIKANCKSNIICIICIRNVKMLELGHLEDTDQVSWPDCEHHPPACWEKGSPGWGGPSRPPRWCWLSWLWCRGTVCKYPGKHHRVQIPFLSHAYVNTIPIHKFSRQIFLCSLKSILRALKRKLSLSFWQTQAEIIISAYWD